MIRERRLHGDRALASLRALEGLDVNYRRAPTAGRSPAPGTGWFIDSLARSLPAEPPGAPTPGGTWETACRLVRDYRFAEPRILRSLFRADAPLPGRDMLLEARFCGLRFDMGVRVGSVTDETLGTGKRARRVWGWSYRTLQGHLEQGELHYQVVKHLHTGEVSFVITGYSRRAPVRNPVISLGFALFGRRTQRRFYRLSAARLDRLVRQELRGVPAPANESHPADGRFVIAPGRR
ncbi:DUF1990 family protein [Streptomyces sp. WMMB 322]|uniref:DUF1990 family protein n=1 Tax=Streptomyces sp. WMMB 322 TaxID=1286821 RepID=UPI0006E36EE1|nr:DUF1990 family protein [Streptomyces sp. WMMB 322]SCK07398.1 protein of unknown function [Streptomyces sp. WMMB 322]